MKHYIVGLTGASCSIYGIRLIEELIKLDNQVSVIFSNNGLKVAGYELKKSVLNKSLNEVKQILFAKKLHDKINIEDNQNIFAPCASGTLSLLL